MTADLAAAYNSGAQRTRVVSESWGEQNLYCANCPSPRLDRLTHNTKASDFQCPDCEFWYQLKGQKSPIRSSVPDGAYAAMMTAIRNDETPNFLFMHYELATWSIQNLLLIPHFAFPPSAIIKRKPLSITARRAGWVGCNIALGRIPIDARIEIVNDRTVASPDAVREKYKKAKAFEGISTKERGWVLDVLAVIRSMGKSEFTNADIYAFVPHFEKLHPGNRHIKDKIRQQLQILRDTGFLRSPSRGLWQPL